MSAVRIGQIWEDCDKRAGGRRLRIIEISTRSPGEDRVTAEVIQERRNGEVIAPQKRRRTQIATRRFRPNSTGYRLIAGPGMPDDRTADELLAAVHARLGGYGVDIKTFGSTGAVEVHWRRLYDRVEPDEQFVGAQTLRDALIEVLKCEDERDAQDAEEAGR